MMPQPLSRLDRLNAINRVRPLSDAEVRYVERQAWGSKGQRRWTRGDVSRLQRYLARGKRPKQIAILMNRSERAIWRMISRQGWTVETAGECSIVWPAPWS